MLRIRDIAASVPARQARERIKTEMFASAGLGAMSGAGLIGLFLVVFWVRGAQLGRQKRIRGAEMVTAGELRSRVRPAHLRALTRLPGGKRLRPYAIAGIPYPGAHRDPAHHRLGHHRLGQDGADLRPGGADPQPGRALRDLRQDGELHPAFFDEGRDVLMNPLDARAPRWSPFLEARNPRDFDMMAAALIPQQKDTVDPFWVTAARQLFSNGAGVLRQKGITENRVLVDHLLKTDLTALAEAMEGTVAQSIVDPDNPKTALSVRAMLTANLSALEFLPDTGKPFSIRDWIGDEDEDRGGFLFLTSRGDQHASLRGLISTWLEIAVNAMLTLAQDDGRRIWVILDELPTLHQVPSLQPGLAESRQFGGCFVLGVQVASALRDLYGRNGAETISGLCGTRVVLAAPDRDTAQWSADSLGRSEIEEVSEGFSYGANTIRDGVSLTPRRELRALALPSEIMRLPNLEGYLKFPGPFPVASIKPQIRRPAEGGRAVRAARGERGGAAWPPGRRGYRGDRPRSPNPATTAASRSRSCRARPGLDGGEAISPAKDGPEPVPLPGEAEDAPEDAGEAGDGKPKTGPQAEGRPGARRRARRRDLKWWPRSGPSPPRPRARATTSATAITRRTIPRIRTPAPGPARERKSSG